MYFVSLNDIEKVKNSFKKLGIKGLKALYNGA